MKVSETVPESKPELPETPSIEPTVPKSSTEEVPKSSTEGPRYSYMYPRKYNLDKTNQPQPAEEVTELPQRDKPKRTDALEKKYASKSYLDSTSKTEPVPI